MNGSVEDNGTAIGAALAANLQLGGTRKTSKITDDQDPEEVEEREAQPVVQRVEYDRQEVGAHQNFRAQSCVDEGVGGDRTAIQKVQR